MDDFERELATMPIEAIYQYLGGAVVGGIDGAWETASIYAEIEDDQGGMIYGRYKTATDEAETRSFEPADEVYYAFDELRRRMRRPDAEPWTTAHFMVSRSGAFDLRFGYGPIPEDRERP